MRNTTGVKFLFNNGLEKIFNAVSFSKDEIGYHISTEETLLLCSFLQHFVYGNTRST